MDFVVVSADVAVVIVAVMFLDKTMTGFLHFFAGGF
jgi:hypothetical protein